MMVGLCVMEHLDVDEEFWNDFFSTRNIIMKET